MKPISKSEASWKFWREDNPSPDNKNDKFTAWAKKQMRRARRRFSIRSYKRRTTMTALTLWMKSGNQIRLRFVAEWKVETKSGSIVGLTISRYRFLDWLPLQKLMMSTINLSEIEAITRG